MVRICVPVHFLFCSFELKKIKIARYVCESAMFCENCTRNSSSRRHSCFPTPLHGITTNWLLYVSFLYLCTFSSFFSSSEVGTYCLSYAHILYDRKVYYGSVIATSKIHIFESTSVSCISYYWAFGKNFHFSRFRLTFSTVIFCLDFSLICNMYIDAYCSLSKSSTHTYRHSFEKSKF